jgi:hypothetical protein
MIVALDNKEKVMVVKPKRIVHDEYMLNLSKITKLPTVWLPCQPLFLSLDVL